jgi:peptidase E
LEDAERLGTDLGATVELLELSTFEADPKGLRKVVTQFNPHVIWVSGGNTFYLRHAMKASGFDSLARELCGPPVGQRAAVYVGASAGAICGSASVHLARFKGWDDPSAAPPDTPTYGLGLAGSSLSVFAHYLPDKHDALIRAKAAEFGLGESGPQGHRIVRLRDTEAFVWSQQASSGSDVSGPGRRGSDVATTFIFGRDGTMSEVEWKEPLPPLVPAPYAHLTEEDLRPCEEKGGVACKGEPAIDPSRAGQRGDSEWFEENSPLGNAQV